MYTQVYDVDEQSVIQLPRFSSKGKLIVTYIYDEEDKASTPQELLDQYKNPTVFVAKNREESKWFLDSIKSQ